MRNRTEEQRDKKEVKTRLFSRSMPSFLTIVQKFKEANELD